jgi:hypothetical protein
MIPRSVCVTALWVGIHKGQFMAAIDQTRGKGDLGGRTEVLQ